jgi:hypothetical protein
MSLLDVCRLGKYTAFVGKAPMSCLLALSSGPADFPFLSWLREFFNPDMTKKWGFKQLKFLTFSARLGDALSDTAAPVSGKSSG